MAKIAKKLTDTEIKSTKPAEKEVNLFDGDGLLLRNRSPGEGREGKDPTKKPMH